MRIRRNETETLNQEKMRALPPWLSWLHPGVRSHWCVNHVTGGAMKQGLEPLVPGQAAPPLTLCVARGQLHGRCGATGAAQTEATEQLLFFD
jgi:hypothetical protein